MNEVGLTAERHEVGGRLNNRAENSHQPLRRREAMQRFRRMKTLQKFGSVHAQVYYHFNRERRLVSSHPTGFSPRDTSLHRPSGALFGLIEAWVERAVLLEELPLLRQPPYNLCFPLLRFAKSMWKILPLTISEISSAGSGF